jgi:hypothetical protein
VGIQSTARTPTEKRIPIKLNSFMRPRSAIMSEKIAQKASAPKMVSAQSDHAVIHVHVDQHRPALHAEHYTPSPTRRALHAEHYTPSKVNNGSPGRIIK